MSEDREAEHLPEVQLKQQNMQGMIKVEMLPDDHTNGNSTESTKNGEPARSTSQRDGWVSHGKPSVLQALNH